MKASILFLLAALAAASQTATILSLDEALGIARDHPRLKSAALGVKAAEARESQAAAFPNPEAGLDLENLLGDKSFSGVQSLETTARIAQPIPLGGKRRLSLAVANAERRMTQLEFQAAEAEVQTDIRMAFVEGLRSQAQSELMQAVVRLDSAFLDATLARRKAGKAGPWEEEKARMLLAQSQVERERAGREKTARLRRLALAMGQKAPGFDSLAGNLEVSLDSPSLESYRQSWSVRPAGEMLSQSSRIRAAEVSLRKAERVPDLRVEAGIRRSNEANAYGLVFGFSIPVPVWNRNRSGIREAETLWDQSRADSAAQALEWEAQLEERYAAMQGAGEEASSLKEKVLPAAERGFTAAREGYAQGRFSYLEIIDAQKTWFETRSRYLDACADFHRHRIALEAGPAAVAGNLAGLSSFTSSSKGGSEP